MQWLFVLHYHGYNIMVYHAISWLLNWAGRWSIQKAYHTMAMIVSIGKPCAILQAESDRRGEHESNKTFSSDKCMHQPSHCSYKICLIHNPRTEKISQESTVYTNMITYWIHGCKAKMHMNVIYLWSDANGKRSLTARSISPTNHCIRPCLPSIFDVPIQTTTLHRKHAVS